MPASTRSCTREYTTKQNECGAPEQAWVYSQDINHIIQVNYRYPRIAMEGYVLMKEQRKT